MAGHRALMPEPADTDADRSRPPSTVLVCTAGREALLVDTLQAIAAVLGPEDELIVVDAGADGGARAVSELGTGPWRVIRAEEPGKSRQLNAGLRAARRDVVVITDDDCRVSPGWIDGMASAFAEPDVGIAFGPVRGLSEIPGRTAARRPTIPGPAPREVWIYSHGAAMAVRAAAAFDVGGFDERLGPGAGVHGEEADLVLRMDAAGWRCWIADAPEVDHVEWRTPAEDLRNRIVYERGAGAWLGAALRREPRSAAELLRLRLRYQATLIRDPASRTHGLRAAAAFGAGLANGLRLAPRCFLEPREPRPGGPGPRVEGSPIGSLPWPAVRGRRCLAIASAAGPVSRELERRGPAQLITLDPADVDRTELGSFDVVVCEGMLAGTPDPAGAVDAVRSLCDGFLLSIEPIDPLLTLLAPGRPLVRRTPAEETHSILNGAAHRTLLEAGGFEIQSVSRHFALPNGQSRNGPRSGRSLRALAAWALAGERSASSATYRAILCRDPVATDR